MRKQLITGIAVLAISTAVLAGCSSGGTPAAPSASDCNNTPSLGDFGVACTDNANCQLLSLQWVSSTAANREFTYTIKGGNDVVKTGKVSPGGATSGFIQSANTTSAAALVLGVGTRKYMISFNIDGCSQVKSGVLRSAK